MKNNIIIIICISIFTIYLSPINSQIVINEILSKNDKTNYDKDGDAEDWIELYNTADTSIQLSNYSITDDDLVIRKWIFPSIEIEAKSFLLLFCSKKDNNDVEELHTNFKISSSGETLYLYDNKSQLIDELDSPPLLVDQSFSRIPDGDASWHLSIPTPGYSNEQKNVFTFDHKPGFYTIPIYQKVKSEFNDSIFYTLDGSIPTDQSLLLGDSIKFGFTYNQPNVISEIITTPQQSDISYKAWQSPTVILDKATIFRCASYRDGVLTSDIYTHSYFIDSTINEKYDMPIVSLVTDRSNLFNQDTGIYVPGNRFDKDDPQWTGNYFQRGRMWERDVHIEFFEKGGKIGFYQNAGLRIHGGKTRHAAQKSLRIYARKDYGKSQIDYPLFQQSNNKKYKRFILRTSMGSWNGETIIQDDLASEIGKDMDIETQHYRPVIVFINGEYWGIHTIKEQIDEKYIASISGFSEDSISLGRWSNPHYEKMDKYLGDNDISKEVHYDYIKTLIDIENFIDYFILELYLKNKDWPGNNIELWRPKTINGKWRWILYDLDAGYGDYTENMLAFATSDDRLPHSTLLFKSLLKNQDFVDSFINRYVILLNSKFRQQAIIPLINKVKELYKSELPNHINRWQYPTSYQSWEDDIVSNILLFLEKRSCAVEKNIQLFFNLDSLNFNCNIDSNKDLMNNERILIYPNPTDGNIYLENRSVNVQLGDLNILDITGRKVKSIKDINLLSGTIEKLNISSLPNGIYIIRFKNELFVNATKIILHK